MNTIDPKEDPNGWVTQTEFAEMLGVSKQRVHQLRASHIGPPFPEPQKIGGGRQFVLLWPRKVAEDYAIARKEYLRSRGNGKVN